MFSPLEKYQTNQVPFVKKAPKNATYIKLDELPEPLNHVYPVDAVYINSKSIYGDSGVILSGEYLINAPQHLTSNIKNMTEDDVLRNYINSNGVGFTRYEYQDKNGVTRVSLNWVDRVWKNIG